MADTPAYPPDHSEKEQLVVTVFPAPIVIPAKVEIHLAAGWTLAFAGVAFGLDRGHIGVCEARDFQLSPMRLQRNQHSR